MKLFASVVEHANIAAASRINNIAASAVSKRISDLEALLGVKLLYRLKDGVEPTPGGIVLVRHVQRVLAQLAELDAEISEYSDGDKGQVRIWANTSAVTQFLPEDLTHYLGQYPDVGILLKEETSGIIVNGVRDGLADIGIFSEHTSHTGLETRVYRRDTLMVIVPRDHPLEGRPGVKMLDVAQYQQVGLQDGSSLQAKLTHEAVVNEKALRFRVKVMSFDGVRRMVEAGLGVAVLPAGAVLPYLGTGMFSSVPLDEPWATRALLIGCREYRSLPVVARSLLDLLAPI
jgi:DNA-binding transcriptional LysR family regulator